MKARCVRVSDVEELRVKELCVKDQELYVTRVLDAKELCQNGSCQHHGLGCGQRRQRHVLAP